MFRGVRDLGCEVEALELLGAEGDVRSCVCQVRPGRDAIRVRVVDERLRGRCNCRHGSLVYTYTS